MMKIVTREIRSPLGALFAGAVDEGVCLLEFVGERASRGLAELEELMQVEVRPGVGSAVLDGQMTVFLDIFSLFEMAEPEIYQQEDDRQRTIAGANVLLAEDTSFFRAVEEKDASGGAVPGRGGEVMRREGYSCVCRCR